MTCRTTLSGMLLLTTTAACGASQPAPPAAAPIDSAEVVAVPAPESSVVAPATTSEDVEASSEPVFGQVPSSQALPESPTTADPSGLVTLVLRPGSGNVRPGPKDRVTVHYVGWNRRGTIFDSSLERGEPTSFGVDQVIEGWTAALQLMVAGERRRVWIPSEMAYGDEPRSPGAPAGALVFDIELLSIAAGADVPADVGAPPTSAQTTSTGLRYRFLSSQPASGPSPGPSSQVLVHYSGWTTDGKEFDSSVRRGKPTRLPVAGVIPGFAEALQLMHVGDKLRVWIPADLAYGTNPRPGAPAGMLVFDLELLETD